MAVYPAEASPLSKPFPPKLFLTNLRVFPNPESTPLHQGKLAELSYPGMEDPARLGTVALQKLQLCQVQF